MLTRKSLLAVLKAHGATFDDKADWSTVEKFISEKALEFVVQGEVVDPAKAWATLDKKTVRVAVTADAGEDVVIDNDSDEKSDSGDEDEDGESESKRLRTRSEKRNARSADDRVTKTDAMLHARKGPMIANADRKRYQARISAGTAVCDDVDYAEKMGATLRYVIHGRKDYAQKLNDLEIIGKVSSTLNDTTNGYLIPPEYVANLIDLAERYGVSLKVANVQKMSRDVMMFPRLTSDGAFIRAQEPTATAMTEQNPTNDLVTLTAGYAYYLGYITNSLLEDSAISVVDMYAKAIARQYARMLDQDYILGDGSGTYNNNNGLATALPGAGGTSGAYFNGSGNSWSALTSSDIRKMPGLVENVADWDAVGFLTSRQWFHQVAMRLDESANQYRRIASNSSSDTADNSLGARLLDPKSDGPHATLLGYPVYFSQVMPTVSASGQQTCFFGDFRAASMIGIRREMAIATSEHYRFAFDQTTIRATARYAVNIHGDGRGSTFGPIVCLLTQ